MELSNIYKFIGKKNNLYELDQKLNANCPASEKNGVGPGSCGGASGKSSEDSSKPIPASKSVNPTAKESRRNATKIAQNLYKKEYNRVQRMGGNKGLFEKNRDEKKWESYKRLVEIDIVKEFPDGVPDDVADALEDENMHMMSNAIADLGMFKNDRINKRLKSRTMENIYNDD